MIPDVQESAIPASVTPIPTSKLCAEDVVIVVNPVLLSYTKFDIFTVGVDKSTSKTSEFAAAAVVMIPVYCCVLLPSATKPKLPNDEFEFVISHCPPLAADTPTSVLIVNKETICAYPLFVMDTPIPFALY